jgi:hypothetical protein
MDGTLGRQLAVGEQRVCEEHSVQLHSLVLHRRQPDERVQHPPESFLGRVALCISTSWEEARHNLEGEPVFMEVEL